MLVSRLVGNRLGLLHCEGDVGEFNATWACEDVFLRMVFLSSIAAAPPAL